MSLMKKIMPNNREARLGVAWVGFGLIGLPVLVYTIGALTLGTGETGFWSFIKTLYQSLLRLQPSAWALVLGPYLLVTVLRFTSRPLRRRRG